MSVIEEYFRLRNAVHDYFGYKEDWVVIPLEDSTNYYWYFNGKRVWYSLEPFTLEAAQAGTNLYSNSLYKQRFLPKWDYLTDDPNGYSMICVDTHTDGNKFLQVFSNARRVTELPQEVLDALDAWSVF